VLIRSLRVFQLLDSMHKFYFKKFRIGSLTALAFITAGLLFSVSSHEGVHGGGPNGQPNNQAMVAMSNTPCVGGMAGPFPCRNINLASFLPTSDIGGGTVNDLWGWTDPSTGKEYALVGRSSGTAFVDLSNPYHPVYLGDLPRPTESSDSLWRGIKVYANHAFIISEAANHGMQIFNLTRLRNVVSPPVTFTEDAHYTDFLRAHTIALNEETGFVYAAGSRGAGNTCQSGLHMVDVRKPLAPVFAGCVSEDGYTHETQCVSYHGPDTKYQGREICFSSNEDTLTIVDVTNKSAPVQLSRTTYLGVGYTHQGWLTENHGYFLLDDEFDERIQGVNSTTYIWNVADLDAPSVTGFYRGPSTAIDHNQYIRGNRAYQSNYRSGLRILDISYIGEAILNEVAFFDIYSIDDLHEFNGAWSNYPFFASGIVIVGGIEQGLFVLIPTRTSPPVLLTEPNSERAIALHSVSFERDPFSLTTERNLLSTDKQTRITLLANNIDSFPGEDLSTLTAQMEGPQLAPSALIVESVRKVPNEGLTQVVVKLPQITSAGDFRVSISLAGTVSNKAIVRLKP
jgi:choice-of-anchor B domain-containing protein